MPGSWLHLSSRFFESLTARDLEQSEIELLSGVLSPPEFDLFMQQPSLDRRHGFEAARHAMSAGGSDAVVRAAALHDVAKRHARLRIPGRVIASVCIKMGIPVSGRFQTYRDHGPIGAAELAEAGSPPLAVAYARSHHGGRPGDVSVENWELLNAADGASERSQSVRFDR